METITVPLSTSHDPAMLPGLIERAMAEAGLVSSRLELRGYAGATHWHIRRPGAKGTLELTYWPSRGRLWFAIHANRRADWMPSAIDQLTARMMLEAT
ncbi:MAG TPA: hypothetical protein VFU22_13500 [Roseiflexaceae bacterium]|nr:hypothetical protein [Roseiflexaceae bacterium]